MNLRAPFGDLNHAIIWSVELILLLGLIFTVHYLLQRGFSQFKERHRFNEHDWRSSIDYPILGPMRTLAWILLTTFVAKFSIYYLGIEDEIPTIALLRTIGVIGCLTWSLLRWKAIFQRSAVLRGTSGRSALKPGSVETLGKFFTIFVLFISILVTLQISGLDITPLVTFSGIGVAALAFATKDVIANFYGGFMIQTSRSFVLNDQIELPQRKIIGYIEDIGWYFTTLRDQEKKPVYIPNALFSTECVINLSRMTHRRIDETLYLQFKDAGKTEQLVAQIRQLLMHHPEIDSNQAILVHIMAFGLFAIHLNVRAYTYATDYEKFRDIQHSILLKICTLIQKEGAMVHLPPREFMAQNPSVLTS
jgi:MscS family membrane protein